jgi:hypothetical protein
MSPLAADQRRIASRDQPGASATGSLEIMPGADDLAHGSAPHFGQQKGWLYI